VFQAGVSLWALGLNMIQGYIVIAIVARKEVCEAEVRFAAFDQASDGILSSDV
jgi:hypothetical protein